MFANYKNSVSGFLELEKDYLHNPAAGKAHVGYLCMRLPLELIEALDAVPRRITVQPGYAIIGSAAIRPDGCSFCRMVPSLLKLDYYKNLQAIIAGSCCDQMRRLMDSLQRELNIPVILFAAPRSFGSDSEYFCSEMKQAFGKLEKILGSEFNIEKILKSVIQRNKLKNRVQTLRTCGKLPNTLLQKIAATPLPSKAVHKFLEDFEDQEISNRTVRLLLAGSIPGIREQEIIEQAGGNIIADVTCLGDRVFHNLTETKGNIIENLYFSYIENNLCPHRRPLQPVLKHIQQIIRERNSSTAGKIQGIIYRSLKYCHPWGLSSERMKSTFSLPFLKLDDDLSSSATESQRTRVEAFIEMLRIQSRRKA